MKKQTKHNKKRNVGIIYEQLLSSLSRALVEGKNGEVKIVKGIIDKHFKPGTELYKEFRLFQAMVKTKVPRESLAIKILGEAKTASVNRNAKKLQREKSMLIKDINYKMGNSNFYNQRVQEYKEYATVQNLLNLWEKGEAGSLQEAIRYESLVQDMLLREEDQHNFEDEKTEDVNKLTVKIMLEKFNKKYDSSLNQMQTKIIKEYVFCSGENSLKSLLNEVKIAAMHEISQVPNSHSNKVICEKVNKVKNNISRLDENIHDDENISRFLLLSKLSEELKEDSV